MEKENKKLREDASREFNDAVRFLVTFVRKRDPRYIPNTQSDADRQQSLRDAAAKQAARSRAANNEKVAQYQLPDWVQQDHGEGDFFTDDSAEEDKDIELLECVVCDKTFKSEKQLEAHERSKKHQKAVQQLRRHLKKEGKELELDHVDTKTFQNSDVSEVSRTDEQSLPSDPDVVDKGSEFEHVPGTDPEDSEVANSVSASLGNLSVAGSGTGDASIKPDESAEASQPGPGIEDEEPPSKKIGKARLKRERKAAAHAQSANEVRLIILMCAFHLPALTLML
jgi:DnaJ family protein A protein 5